MTAEQGTALHTLAELDARRQELMDEAERIDRQLDALRVRQGEAEKIAKDARRARSKAWDEAFLAAKKLGMTDLQAKSTANLEVSDLDDQMEEAVRIVKAMDRAHQDKVLRVKVLRDFSEVVRAQCYVVNSEIKAMGG